MAHRAMARRWLRFTIIAVGAVAALIALHEILFPSLVHGTGLWAEIHTAIHLGMFVLLIPLFIAISTLWRAELALDRYGNALHVGYAALEKTVAEKTSALTVSESLMCSLLDAVEDRIVAVDADGRIVKANRVAAEQAQCDPAGRMFEEVFPAPPRAQERRSELALIRYTFQTRTPQRGRLIRVPDVDQRARLLAIDTYPVPDPRGDVGCVIAIARDVTEEKEAEIHKQHREKMAALGMLAAGIAHDLGNPLASLSIELQLFERECQVPSYVEMLKVLNTHVDRITRALRDMVDFARRRTDQVEEVAINQSLTDALRLVRHAQRSRRIQVETDFPPTLPRLRIRQDDLVLVLVNLLLNAFDAMPNGGTVTVAAASSERGEIVVWVKDAGVGMPPEVRERATEVLYTTKKDGTGFGLAVSADVMRAVGGRLELASEPGQGTTVSLMFPAAA